MTSSHQIVKDAVDDLLVKAPLLTEGPEVELHGFQLEAEIVRNITDTNGSKIGLACARANTGELGTFQTNLVVPSWSGIGKCLKLLTRRRRHNGILTPIRKKIEGQPPAIGS
jgi:hypothetical protein